MKKTKVVIASVLKPIDDTRMLEKFGLSMAETNKYDINIIGIESKNTPSYNNVSFHPLPTVKRTSWKRLMYKWKVLGILIKVKPKIIIANTHELLLVISLYKILFGGQIIYDIRENYYMNIRNTQVFPQYLRWPVAAYVRLKEWLSKPFIQHYILAERIYQSQLPFLSKEQTVIENKYAPRKDERTAYRHPDHRYIDLVFTGTLSRENGIFEAIELTKKLHALNEHIRLRIVGYCALRSDLESLKAAIAHLDFIELNGGDHLVPHREIVEAIEKADFGFVLKKNNNGTNDQKLLTRIFEYTANKLPILLIDNPSWTAYCSQFNAAIIIDPNLDMKELLVAMQNKTFYDRGDVSQSLWSSEAPKLLSILG
jgi:glycosyltransferase involved in cell wall biosynthesis